MEVENTFCLLKPEAYIFRKTDYIKNRISASGLAVTENWTIKLKFYDIFKLYQDWFPRITMSLRFYPLFKTELYVLKGTGSINRMNDLKYRIRSELGGFITGGYVHAPDNCDEFHRSMKVLMKRRQL